MTDDARVHPDPHPASFRDPAGFVYVANGVVYRQVNRRYQPQYDRLMASGLYEALVTRGWMVPHEEVSVDATAGADVYRILKPAPVPYIAYPYEWAFSQLKDAALLTLDIQSLSLTLGMTLKDASAYNVQFIGSRPVFIDTLSFETYEDGAPWVAYRQFCQHFLAPLALMARVDVRLGRLLRDFLDGIPLDLASTLLPATTWLRFGLLVHLHAHARSQKRHERDGRTTSAIATPTLPKARQVALIESLRRVVAALALPRMTTEWGDYYDETNYSAEAMAAKETLVRRLVDTFAAPGETIHDLGANTGRFSRLLAGPGRYVVSHDVDALAVERHYLHNRSSNVEGVLPLLLDLTNPSPSVGWALVERASVIDRMSRGTVVALALIHHLAITNNVPLARVAAFFAAVANTIVIEFVPKEDSQVRRLLATREDVFPGYTQAAFEAAFGAHFEILTKDEVPDTVRTLYAMRRR